MGGLGQLGIRFANAALFVACTFLTAGIVNDVGGAMLTPERAAAAPNPRVDSARRPSWSDREVILTRNLFGAKLFEEAAPVVVEVPVEETKLPLRLLGTAASGDERVSTAALEDTSKREHQVVMVGDRLTYHGRVQVARIERGRVLLDNAGKMEELLLNEDLPTANARASASRTPARSSRRDRTTSRLSSRLQELRDRVRDEREDRPSPRNPSNLFSEARIVPKYEEGNMVGIQLGAIKEGSMYEKFGLEDGDVISELNGIPIDNPAASGKLLKELTEAKAFEFVVNGESRSLSAEEVSRLLESDD